MMTSSVVTPSMFCALLPMVIQMQGSGIIEDEQEEENIASSPMSSEPFHQISRGQQQTGGNHWRASNQLSNSHQSP